jgi:uncharacterized protein involved in exopolysaccharide biosynthesis
MDGKKIMSQDLFVGLLLGFFAGIGFMLIIESYLNEANKKKKAKRTGEK